MSLEEDEHKALAELEPLFIAALTAHEAGRVDDAEDMLKQILKVEPRLPEPHMELGRIYLATERLVDAEEHARTSLEALENTGPWIDALEDHVVLSLAHALLAEVLRRRLEEDDVIFGDPDVFRRLVSEAQLHFETAAKLDPSDETSSYYAFFMGAPEGEKSAIALPGGDLSDDDEEP